MTPRRQNEHELGYKKWFKRSALPRVQVRLIPFRDEREDATHVVVENDDVSALLAAIRRLPRDGGTRMAAAQLRDDEEQPDVILFFCDGFNTLGTEVVPPPFECPAYVFFGISPAFEFAPPVGSC